MDNNTNFQFCKGCNWSAVATNFHGIAASHSRPGTTFAELKVSIATHRGLLQHPELPPGYNFPGITAS